MLDLVFSHHDAAAGDAGGPRLADDTRECLDVAAGANGRNAGTRWFGRDPVTETGEHTQERIRERDGEFRDGLRALLNLGHPADAAMNGQPWRTTSGAGFADENDLCDELPTVADNPSQTADGDETDVVSIPVGPPFSEPDAPPPVGGGPLSVVSEGSAFPADGMSPERETASPAPFPVDLEGSDLKHDGLEDADKPVVTADATAASVVHAQARRSWINTGSAPGEVSEPATGAPDDLVASLSQALREPAVPAVAMGRAGASAKPAPGIELADLSALADPGRHSSKTADNRHDVAETTFDTGKTQSSAVAADCRDADDQAATVNQVTINGYPGVHDLAAQSKVSSPKSAAEVQVNASDDASAEPVRFSIAEHDLMDRHDAPDHRSPMSAGTESVGAEPAAAGRESAPITGSAAADPSPDVMPRVDGLMTDQAATTSATGSLTPAGPTPMERVMTVAEATENLDRLVLRSVNMEGGGLRLELMPAALGRLVVQCRESEGGLTVDIGVADPAVRSLLMTQEQGLRDALESQGLSLGRFSVSCDGRDGHAPGQENRQFTALHEHRETAPGRPAVSEAAPDTFRRPERERNRWVA